MSHYRSCSIIIEALGGAGKPFAQISGSTSGSCVANRQGALLNSVKLTSGKPVRDHILVAA